MRLLYLFIFLVFISCTKDKKYQYELNTVEVGNTGGTKTNKKSTLEFISIAYTDLFGTTIPQNKLINISTAYSSFGDEKLIEERIVATFLDDPAVALPATVSINGDTSAFIKNTYRKFYNRNPTASEDYYWLNLIRTNGSVNPAVIYYSIMTSDEYRFY